MSVFPYTGIATTEEDGYKLKTGADWSIVKMTFDATAPPGTGDDDTAGYLEGSMWVDVTNDKGYLCLDNATGAAVWTEITGGAGGGEANTGSNVNVDGEGVFDGKVGDDLQFRGIADLGSGRISVALDAVNNTIDLDVVEASLDIGNMGGSLAGDAAHGNLSGGALHAVATTSVAGFMSAADKTKIDSLDVDGSVYLTVQKHTAGTINPGDVVYIQGYDVGDDVPTVNVADANSASFMPAAGVAVDSITDTVSGRILVTGVITGFDTSAWVTGQELYVSHVAGDFSISPPTGTAAIVQRVGIVLKDDVSGTILVNFGPEDQQKKLEDDHFWLAIGGEGHDQAQVIDLTDQAAPDEANFHLFGWDVGAGAHRRVTISNISHDGLADFVADEHVAHSGVSITAGVGLTGGGAIDVTRTIDIDWPGLTDETDIDLADSIAVYDTSAAAHREALLSDVEVGFSQNVYRDAIKATAGTITKGQTVRIIGHDGTQITVETGDANLGAVIGVANESITDGAAGRVLVSGLLAGFDTSTPGWSVNDLLWVSATAGEMAGSEPTGSLDYITQIGRVMRVHATLGEVWIHPPFVQRGQDGPLGMPNLEENHFYMGNVTRQAQKREIDDLTADASPDGAADYVMTWDASEAGLLKHKKVLLDNLPSAGGGEINTGSNVNITGTGVFDGKVTFDLQFRGIDTPVGSGLDHSFDAVDNVIDINVDLADLAAGTLDTAADNFAFIDITDGLTKEAALSAIDHDQLTGFNSNEHVSHAAVSITAGIGLSGGGTIEATRTIDLDIDQMAIVALDTSADHIAFNDATDGVTKRDLISSIDHDQLTNFLSDEHVAHSGVSITAGVGLTGGGTIAATRTIDLDINGLTTDNLINPTGDFLAYYDATPGEHNKINPDNFVRVAVAGITADLILGDDIDMNGVGGPFDIKNIDQVTFHDIHDNGTVTTTLTVDWAANGNIQRVILNGNTALSFTAPSAPAHIQLFWQQDGTTGGRAPTWPSTVRWVDNTEPTWATGTNDWNVATFTYDNDTWISGINYMGMGAKFT